MNATAFTTVLHGLTVLMDGGILVSKTTAIEKFGGTGNRILAGANPFVNAPAGNCATSTTVMVHQTELSNGNILYAHAAATANNKIGIVSSTGVVAAGDCLITAAVAGPTTTALPTNVMVHSTGKLLVAYGSTTLGSNLVQAYDLNVTTSAVTGSTAAFTNTSVIQGPTAMVEDTSTQMVYIAMGTSTFNTIEKFTFNSTTKTLTRVGSAPFINASLYTKCISGMVVAD